MENRRWLFFILMGMSLAISAEYELFEVSYAHLMEEDVHAFLGTQGDQWDSHWDMLCALSGSIFVLVFFSQWHDRLIQKSHISFK